MNLCRGRIPWRQPRDRRKWYQTNPDRYHRSYIRPSSRCSSRSYSRDSRQSCSQHHTCIRKEALHPTTKMAYRSTPLKHLKGFMKTHHLQTPSHLTHMMSILYNLMMPIMNHTSSSSFSYQILKNSPVKLPQSSQKHSLQDHHFPEVVQDINTSRSKQLTKSTVITRPSHIPVLETYTSDKITSIPGPCNTKITKKSFIPRPYADNTTASDSR